MLGPSLTPQVGGGVVIIHALTVEKITFQGVFDIEVKEDEDGMARVLCGRLTSSEYTKASATKQAEDDGKGDFDFEGEQVHKLDEDLWYILNDKLDGAQPRWKLKGLREGDGLQAH